MAIKEIKPGKGDSVFPSFSPQPGVTLNFPSTGPSMPIQNPHDVTRVLREINENRLLEAEYHRVIGPPGVGGSGTSSSLPARRFFVDPASGVISVDLEDPEGLTYKDAVAVSASIKESKRTEQSDEYGGAVNLIRAAKEMQPQPQGEQERPRNWYVDRSGRMQYDPVEGEMTMSEARALSDSILATREPPNVMTPEKIELMAMKMQKENDDKWRERFQEMQERYRDGEGGRNNQPPFLFGEGGAPVINPKAKLGISEIMGFMFLQNMQNKSNADPMFTDSTGQTMKLPQWLEMKKWEKEEGRKDQMTSQIAELIADGRKELPTIVQTLKTVMSKRSEVPQLESGQKQIKQPKAPPQVEYAKGFCQGCNEPQYMISTPAVLPCKKCGNLNFFGTDAEQEHFRRVLMGEGPPPVVPKHETPPIPPPFPPFQPPPQAETAPEPVLQPLEPPIDGTAPYYPAAGKEEYSLSEGPYATIRPDPEIDRPSTVMQGPPHMEITVEEKPEPYISDADKARIAQGLEPTPVKKPTQHSRRRNKNA